MVHLWSPVDDGGFYSEDCPGRGPPLSPVDDGGFYSEDCPQDVVHLWPPVDDGGFYPVKIALRTWSTFGHL